MKRQYRKLGLIILLVLGAAGIFDFILLFRYSPGINLGTLLPALAGIIMVYTSLRRLLGKDPLFKIRNTALKKFIAAVAGVFVLSFIVIEAVIIYSAHTDPGSDIDYAIVLGAGLNGSRVSITLQNRLDQCITFLKKNPETKAVVTGGKGAGETVTEAGAMEEYLIRNYISPDRIIKEERASSTMENFIYSKALLPESSRKYKVMVITSDFHMFRAKMLARRNGFIPYGLPSKTWPGVLPNCYVREYFAVIKSFLFDR